MRDNPVNAELKLENYCGNRLASRAVRSNENEEHVVKNFRRWIYAELKDVPGDSQILDVGCGDASFTRHLARYSSEVTGLHRVAAQAAQNQRLYPEITFLPHDMSDPVPFVDGTFDIIWCSGVLEHLTNPGFAMREMYRTLAPGGKLLVTVPYNSWLKDLMCTLFKWDQNFTTAESHLHYFTKNSLEKITRDAGFVSLQLKTCSVYHPLHDFFIPTNILLKAEKSPFAPHTVSFSRHRRDRCETVRPAPAAAKPEPVATIWAGPLSFQFCPAAC
jgi:SAM-dependent methyltransferase